MINKRGEIIIIGSRGGIEIQPRMLITKTASMTGVNLFNQTREEREEALAREREEKRRSALSAARGETLPEADGRTYTECDINTNGADSRGAERLIFSNDGLYFYTSDHYASFTELTVDGGQVVWNH